MPHPGSEEIYEVPEVNPTVARSFNKETQRKVEAGEQYRIVILTNCSSGKIAKDVLVNSLSLNA